MSKKTNSKVGAVLVGPTLVIGGALALWENEGRFDYHQAAEDAAVIAAPDESTGQPIAYTESLNTEIPIPGDYVVEFMGYHSVRRRAEIYSWERDEDSDGDVTWSLDWQSSLESNARNQGLRKVLSSASLYPEVYELGSLNISPEKIHFVDGSVAIKPASIQLSSEGASLQLEPSVDYFHLDKGRGDDLGDERVSFDGIRNAPTASYFGLIVNERAVGKQFEQNDGFISAIIDNDGVLHHLVNGERASALEKIRADLVRKTWLVRIFGTLAIVFGFLVFFKVFLTLLYRIPLIGGLIQFGAFLLSLILGLSLALIVMFSSVVFHHPLTIALPLVLVIGGVIWFVRKSRTAGNNAKQALAVKLEAQQMASVAPPPLPPPSAAQPPALPPMPIPPQPELIERSFKNLALVAMAEGDLDRRENRILSSWGRDNGISAERMKEILDSAHADSSEAHPATRDDLELMACVAMADGVLSNKEWEFLLKIAGTIGLKPEDVRKMLTDIENGTLVPA